MIAGARAQFAGAEADVLNMSSTGALVRTGKKQAPGSQWPLVLEVDGTPAALTVRVVRCEPVAGPVRTASGKFAIGITYVNPSEAAVAWLDRVCRAGRRSDAGNKRGVRVSLVRRCPKCQSRDVAKEARRSYSCCQCGLVFTGIRVGSSVSPADVLDTIRRDQPHGGASAAAVYSAA